LKVRPTSKETRKELIRILRERYRTSTKAQKGRKGLCPSASGLTPGFFALATPGGQWRKARSRA
jgi:hypothetical protein